MEEELNDLEVNWLIDDYGFCLQVQKRKKRGKTEKEGARVGFYCGRIVNCEIAGTEEIMERKKG